MKLEITTQIRKKIYELCNRSIHSNWILEDAIKIEGLKSTIDQNASMFDFFLFIIESINNNRLDLHSFTESCCIVIKSKSKEEGSYYKPFSEAGEGIMNVLKFLTDAFIISETDKVEKKKEESKDDESKDDEFICPVEVD
jgi:hypothetical protein